MRVAIEWTELLVARRGATGEDRDRLAWAAGTAVGHGFAGQARKILESAALPGLVPDLDAALRVLAG